MLLSSHTWMSYCRGIQELRYDVFSGIAMSFCGAQSRSAALSVCTSFLFVCLQMIPPGKHLFAFTVSIVPFVRSHRCRVLDHKFELCSTSVAANNCEKATNNSCCTISGIIELYSEFRFDGEAVPVCYLQSLSC